MSDAQGFLYTKVSTVSGGRMVTRLGMGYLHLNDGGASGYVDYPPFTA